jgi:hypothetical protein
VEHGLIADGNDGMPSKGVRSLKHQIWLLFQTLNKQQNYWVSVKVKGSSRCAPSRAEIMFFSPPLSSSLCFVLWVRSPHFGDILFLLPACLAKMVPMCDI